MPEVTEQPSTESRKVDHVRINLEENVNFPNLTTGLEKYRFLHCAVPELNLENVNTSTTIFGKTLNAPILISSMTGGAELANRINRNLAQAAQKHRIAMGLGSQRAALEDEALAYTFRIRDIAPDILLFANMGAVQLNYGYDAEDMQRAVEMVQADALILHFNVLQEAVQPEGDTNFAGILKKVEQVCHIVNVPVIAKEVGWGFSKENVRHLSNAGIAAIDVAGSGGTSWSEVEYHRAPTAFHAQVARAFADWGIPTADAIQYARSTNPDLLVFASGGLRDGVDIAKSIALGANLAGLASPFLKAANQSPEAVDDLIHILTTQLRIAMFCSATSNIHELGKAPLITTEG
ncbi:MAG: type 2 isopentenyl-diphosphate Delta-isomerase [Anaerolineae bacterium]|nr:type 2 isopentenyl-diphosphate Delta-isomerase [Anaerolineae bacterium]MDQ7037072.1 type 2 isopentenyl-diphosphate Delta-isomerase [Anaerolineae bacterium]